MAHATIKKRGPQSTILLTMLGQEYRWHSKHANDSPPGLQNKERRGASMLTLAPWCLLNWAYPPPKTHVAESAAVEPSLAIWEPLHLWDQDFLFSPIFQGNAFLFFLSTPSSFRLPAPHYDRRLYRRQSSSNCPWVSVSLGTPLLSSENAPHTDFYSLLR